MPTPIPTVFPVEVKVELTFLVNSPEDFEYLTTLTPEEGLISDASEIFENLDLNCTAVNGVKTT
jgi:hypothetical protein